MELKYALPYFSYSPHIPNFVRKTIFDSGINGDAFVCDGEIIISLNDTDKKIESFFELLGKKLPLSVYLKSGEVVDKPIIPTFCGEERYVDLGLCPECLELLFDKESGMFLDMSTECELCGSAEKRHIECDMDDVIKRVSQNESVSINDTTYHTFEAKDSDSLIILDVNALKNDFFVSSDEMLLLNSIERPFVWLAKRADSNAKVPNLAKCRLPSSAIEYIVAYHLKQKGIGYLACSSKESQLLVMSVEGQMVIISGDRGYLPLNLKIKKTKLSTLSIAKGYSATIDDNSECAHITPLQKLKTKPIKQIAILKGENISIEHPNQKVFKDYEAAILGVANEHGLGSAIGAYLGEDSQNSGVYILENGAIKPIALIKVDSSANELLQKIKEEEGGERLVQKFSQRFGLPQNLDAKVDSLKGIFELFYSFVMDDMPKGALFSHAFMVSQSVSLDRSVKIDMKSYEADGVLFFDPSRTLRSILSFRMADVSAEMFFYALHESFCDYINEQIGQNVRKYGTKECVIAGNFLANKMFTKRLLKHSNNIYQIKMSKYLPLDGALLSIGGIFAAAN